MPNSHISMDSPPLPKVHIIVLNWNGWRDTIECLESVMRLSYPNFQVIVCDNASSDDSLKFIDQWALGSIEAECASVPLRVLSCPAVSKPIDLRRLSIDDLDAFDTPVRERLVLLQTGANRGFAGGNNVGLRFALAQGTDYVWLLNNDTVVAPDALSKLVARMEERSDAGICGSTLVYYDNPRIVQAWGGASYNKWLARGTHLGEGADATEFVAAEEIERRMNYIVGASMLISRAFLQNIGLMSEEYFLYFEEIDWATRAEGLFTLAYAPRSVVFHKEGKSIGSHSDRRKRSTLSEAYAARNRILFSSKRYSFFVQISVLCIVLLTALSRFLTWRPRNGLAMLASALTAFFNRWHS